ncbi:DUF1289 domain-containing protein [Aureimonas sp. AU12]|uniref:DUF1289 domain-containing protein n=1 Tax=Aureimonas sp. AU12 TaxID=1638161 RepID=UPI000783CDEF|nr:DUF1289 domain-containing protein [Aureimonas sp. AU12]
MTIDPALILPQAAVPSPCISLCVLDPATQWCLGCGRSIDEIMAWGSAAAAERRIVLERLPERLQSLRQPAAERGDA